MRSTEVWSSLWRWDWLQGSQSQLKSSGWNIRTVWSDVVITKKDQSLYKCKIFVLYIVLQERINKERIICMINMGAYSQFYGERESDPNELNEWPAPVYLGGELDNLFKSTMTWIFFSIHQNNFFPLEEIMFITKKKRSNITGVYTVKTSILVLRWPELETAFLPSLGIIWQ